MAIKTLARSASRFGPWDVLFTGADALEGKNQGEDDFRAWGGAIANTAGGLIGAGVGGVLGGLTSFGLGAPAGAISGSAIGGTTAGWLFDRADELFRGDTGKPKAKSKKLANNYIKQQKGNKNMATFLGYDANGNQLFRPDPDDYDFGDLTGNLAALGAVGYTGNKVVRNIPNAARYVGDVADNIRTAGATIGGPNPWTTATKAGLTDAASTAARKGASFWRNVPLAGKVVGAGLLAKGIDDALGSPVYNTVTGMADAATGNNFDLDRKGQQRIGKRPEDRVAFDPNGNPVRPPVMVDNAGNPVSRRQNEFEQRQKMVGDMSDANFQRVRQAEQEMYDRNLRDAYEKGMIGLQSQQAQQLFNAYTNSIPRSVAAQMNAISSFRI